jgi:hypothetical protein
MFDNGTNSLFSENILYNSSQFLSVIIVAWDIVIFFTSLTSGRSFNILICKYAKAQAIHKNNKVQRIQRIRFFHFISHFSGALNVLVVNFFGVYAFKGFLCITIFFNL